MPNVFTNLNPNLRPSIQNFAKWAMVLDGQNIPRYMNVTGGYELMHLDPTTVITANEAATGTMNGVVKYFYVEYNFNSSDGTMLTGHETNPSPIFTTGTLVNKKVTLTLPATALNTGFTHLKIYATDEDGEIFYYIGYVAIGTTTFEDNNAVRDALVPFGKVVQNVDGSSTQTYLNYPVSNHRFVTATKTRLVTCGVRDYSDGTVSVTSGSAAVTGTGTLFTRAFVGSTVYFAGQATAYVVQSIASATSLTLSSNYAGTTLTDAAHVITESQDIVRWSAMNPLSGIPMWWAFPTSHWREVRRKDDSGFKGMASLGDQVVVFKERSHYLLTESGDDFLVTESSTRVGTCGADTLVSIPDTGQVIFVTIEGKLYITSGVEARDLGVSLNTMPDGVNLANSENFVATWDDQRKWYILGYTSSGQTQNNKVLIYDDFLKEHYLWDIPVNCLKTFETTEDSETVFKPYMGSVGGFVYKMLTGYNLGGTGDNLIGTATGFGADTLTNTSADFNVTDDGLKDVWVNLYDSSGVWKELRRILSNTETVLTMDGSWTSTPLTGWAYEIGGIHWFWESKVFDLEESATVRDCLLKFKRVDSNRNVLVRFYYSEDADMEGDNASYTMTFNLANNYYRPLSLPDNRSRFFKFRIEGHGTADPAVISAISMNIVGHRV